MTAVARLRAALKSAKGESVEVVSADVNEVCRMAKDSAALAKKHPAGLHELHPITTEELKQLLSQVE